MTQGNNVSMAVGVDVSKDGAVELLGTVRMDEVAAVISQKHEIGIGVGNVRTLDAGSKFAQRQVGSDDAQQLAVLLDRLAV